MSRIYFRFVFLLDQPFFQIENGLVEGGYVDLEFGKAGEFEVALHVL